MKDWFGWKRKLMPCRTRLIPCRTSFDGLTIQFEKVRDDIKKLGEGYEDGMRRLSTEIKNINRRWAEKWSPHDLAIKDHGKRITALEQRHK